MADFETPATKADIAAVLQELREVRRSQDAIRGGIASINARFRAILTRTPTVESVVTHCADRSSVPPSRPPSPDRPARPEDSASAALQALRAEMLLCFDRCEQFMLTRLALFESRIVAALEDCRLRIEKRPAA